jgi:hypothetical protein
VRLGDPVDGLHDHHKTTDVANVDVDAKGLSLGDSNVITEDVYRDGKKRRFTLPAAAG